LQISRFGRDIPIEQPQPPDTTQEDRVKVTLKKKNEAKGGER
jgi:hypothetical protein